MTPLPQQSSPSARDEESRWVAVEDRRRRRVAFEETARSMLGYLEYSEDLKVIVTELQEQLGMLEEAGISIKLPSRQETRTASHAGHRRWIVEEMSLESPRKMQDVQVVMGETAGKEMRV